MWSSDVGDSYNVKQQFIYFYSQSFWEYYVNRIYMFI